MCCFFVFLGDGDLTVFVASVGLTSDGLDEAADELMALMCTGGSSSVE